MKLTLGKKKIPSLSSPLVGGREVEGVTAGRISLGRLSFEAGRPEGKKISL